VFLFVGNICVLSPLFRSAYIDLYSDWVFRVEDTPAATVCQNAPVKLQEACEKASSKNSGSGGDQGLGSSSSDGGKPKKVRERRVFS
jgi:hypothetical protein